MLQREAGWDLCFGNSFLNLVLKMFLNISQHRRPVWEFGVTQEIGHSELGLKVVHQKTRNYLEHPDEVQAGVVYVYHPFVQTRQCLDLLVFWSHRLTGLGQERKIVFVTGAQNHGVDFNFIIILQDN